MVTTTPRLRVNQRRQDAEQNKTRESLSAWTAAERKQLQHWLGGQIIPFSVWKALTLRNPMMGFFLNSPRGLAGVDIIEQRRHQ
jgi:hypothetical protein